MPKMNSIYANSFLDALFKKPTFTTKSIKQISKISNNQTLYNLIEKFAEDTQFIVVTHNKDTMKSSGTLYGVTMEEKGVSKLVSVKLN